MIALQAVCRRPSLSLPQSFPQRGDRCRRVRLVDEITAWRIVQLVGGEAKGGGSSPQPVVQIADGFAAIEPGESVAVAVIVVCSRRRQGGLGTVQLRPGQRQIVDFHLCRVGIAARKMRPRLLQKRLRSIDGQA